MGEGRRSDLGLAVTTGTANASWTWSGQRSAQGGGAQPLQECITELGHHGQTLIDVANRVAIWPTALRWRCEQGMLGMGNSIEVSSIKSTVGN